MDGICGHKLKQTMVRVVVPALFFALISVAGGSRLVAQTSSEHLSAATERSASTTDDPELNKEEVVSGDLAEGSSDGTSEGSEEVTCLWIKAFEECVVQGGGARSCKAARPAGPEQGGHDVGSPDGGCLRKLVAANCRGLGGIISGKAQSTPSSAAACGNGMLQKGTSLGEFLGSLKSGIPEAKQHIEVFLDNECTSVVPKTQAKICGFTGATWCPVSLLWDQSALTQNTRTVVKFPLDPNREGSFTVWQGSEHAPLLVFDPEHQGKVTSGRQLLGSFSFGGRRRSSTQETVGGPTPFLPWENGFVALERLDIDQDGKISGVELAPLSLWFDRLKDGVANPGEVLPVTTLGVTALYYRDPVLVHGGRELRLEGGYERVVDGRVEKGAAVDWYAETFSSESEAVKALGPVMRGGVEYFKANPVGQRSEWRERPFDFATKRSATDASDVSGFWIWQISGASGFDSPGIFVLRQEGGSTVTGFSVVESPVASNSLSVRNVLAFLPVEGKVEPAQQGLHLVFITSDPESGMIATSTATLSGNGGVLKGTTTQSFMSKGAETSASITYDWIAQKLVGDPGLSDSLP